MSLNNIISKVYNNILAIGFTLIVLTMIFSSLFSVFQMRERYQITINTVEQQNYNTELLSTMSHAVLKRTIILMEMIQSDDPFKNDELFMQLNELKTEFAVSKALFESQELVPRLQKLLNTQSELVKIHSPIVDNLYELIQQDRSKALDVYRDVLLPRLQINLKLIQDMVHNQFGNAQDSLTQSKLERDDDYNIAVIINLISIVISIMLIMYIFRKQKISDNNLTSLATTDVLTSLPNRVNFIDNIEQTIKDKQFTTFALIFFDIDYFKSINDNYGHEIGDEVLKLFSTKINDSITEDDILSRFGGDEFVLLLRSINNEAQAIQFVSKLSKSLDTSFNIERNQIFISSSIGASLYSKNQANNSKTLLKNADVAMYSAKESGRNCFKFYSKETNDRMEKEYALTHALHTILKNNNHNDELHIMYQPLLNINTETTSDCEALIRWTDTSGKQISPAEFIPLAEKSNLIEKINLFVINETCKQQQAWQLSGKESIRININLSGNKCIFTRLLNQLRSNISEMGLCPTLLGIELTERTLNEISQETIEELDSLRKQGIKISIDDFGTNYSSLMNLKKLPITTLKIDKGFIDGLPEDKDNRALVKTIITLGHALELDIVAEGVETMGQLEFLKEQGCNSIQGYFYQYPLGHNKIIELQTAA